MTLLDRIATVNSIQARRYQRLSGRALEIATHGIIRHFNACDRYGVDPDTSALREIIDDALDGRAVYSEVDKPPTSLRPHYSTNVKLVDQPWVRELMARESFTTAEAAELSGRANQGADVLTRLRNAWGLKLVAVGRAEGGHPYAKRFRLERVEEEA